LAVAFLATDRGEHAGCLTVTTSGASCTLSGCYPCKGDHLATPSNGVLSDESLCWNMARPSLALDWASCSRA